jgi:hypothetical protein
MPAVTTIVSPGTRKPKKAADSSAAPRKRTT